MNSLVEKSLAVNPFQGQVKVDKKPEVITGVEVILDEAIERTMEHYDNAYRFCCYGFGNYLSYTEFETLTPAKIQLVLMNILNKHNPSIYEPDWRWTIDDLFISRLIKDSYNAGNNNFILNPQESKISLIELDGITDNPLHVTILGNAANYLGYGSDDCIFEICGGVNDNCGSYSRNSVYNISGNAGERCGKGSYHCVYNINGNVDFCCGEDSTSSNYNLNGNAEFMLGYKSKSCVYNLKGKTTADFRGNCMREATFKVMDEEVYKLLITTLPKNSNTMQLMNEQGMILEETKQ